MLHLGDITRIHGAGVPAVEAVIGGSPCQDLSVAGKRAGLDGERSGLFMDQIRVIKEMRDYDKRVNARTGPDVRPRYMVWENVPGAFSSAGGEDFRAVLEETARIAEKDAVIPRPENGKWQTAGCIMGDGWSIAWRVLDAQFWGVPQRRRRIALVADFGGDTAPEILFERESVSGDSQESGTAREGTAGNAENGFGAAVDGVKCLTPWDCQSKRVFDTDGAMSTYQAMGDGGANNVAVCYSFDALASNSMKSANPNSGCREVECSKTLDCFDPNPSKNQGGIAVVQSCVAIGFKPRQSEKARSLGCEVKKAPSLETSQNAAICIQGNCIDRADTAGCNGKGWRDDDVSFTLNTIDRPAVYAIENHPADSRCNISDDGIVQTLSSRMGTGGGNVPMCMSMQGFGDYRESEVSSPCKSRDFKDATDLVCAVDCRNGTENPGTNGTLQAKSNGGMSLNLQNTVRVQNLVRRLTPMECERLQGYPDGWTDIGEWVDSKGKKHESSDSARYKSLGNSIALPPWRFVLSRLNAYLTEHTMASLFDGIGGFPLIWRELNGDGKCLWASEIEEFPIAVTKRRLGDELQ